MPMDAKLYQLLLETFKAELQELHQSLIDGLLSLEKVTTKEALEDILKNLFRYSHNMKGAAASASVKPIATMAHRLEDLFTEWRETEHFPDKKQITACLAVADNLFPVLKSHCDGEAVDVETYLAPLEGGKSLAKESAELPQLEYIRIPLIRIERASAKASELITYQLKLNNWFKEISHILRGTTQLNDANLHLFSLQKKLTTILEDREQFLGEFSRSVHTLQDELSAMRMLPISTVLSPVARVVRDVATALKKSVELQIEGGEIELDKSVLEAIKDPLQHLVRNAIDHGIESEQQRKKLNKPIPAKLKINIAQISGKIIIQLSDDGQGINLEAIKKQALAKELHTKDELLRLDSEQILNLIFISGFSLHDKVTEISGRGVGLDVVKSNINNIKGTIAVESKVGAGTCFTLTLPLTLATNRGVFFRVKDHIYMLPSLTINALYDINPSELKRVNNQYILVVDNRPIPVKTVGTLLNIEHAKPEINHPYHGLLIDYNAKPIILLVDSIIDEHDCVVKPLPFPFAQLEHYIGVTLTGEGELVLVLDPGKLVHMALTDKTDWLEENSKSSIEKKVVLKKRVLVVDDSLTTRTLCSNAIEAAGYAAISTSDGKKAWQLLQKENFDCVVTDILMPEMDGFELTELIKNNKKYHHIPVIIVSLLDSTEDKEKGLALGANAYIVKSEFDTISLIEVMESLL